MANSANIPDGSRIGGRKVKFVRRVRLGRSSEGISPAGEKGIDTGENVAIPDDVFIVIPHGRKKDPFEATEVRFPKSEIAEVLATRFLSNGSVVLVDDDTDLGRAEPKKTKTAKGRGK